jgi:ArsR family transcriptional regulator
LFFALGRYGSAGPATNLTGVVESMTHPPDDATDVMIATDVLARAAEVIKCLGHPLRLRLLESLEHGERAVGELQEYSGASQTAVSQHLSALRARGIVDSRRESTRVFYRITEPKVQPILNCIRTCDLDL